MGRYIGRHRKTNKHGKQIKGPGYYFGLATIFCVATLVAVSGI